MRQGCRKSLSTDQMSAISPQTETIVAKPFDLELGPSSTLTSVESRSQLPSKGRPGLITTLSFPSKTQVHLPIEHSTEAKTLRRPHDNSRFVPKRFGIPTGA